MSSVVLNCKIQCFDHLFYIFSPHIFNIVGRLNDVDSASAYGRQKLLELFFKKPFLSPLKQLIVAGVSLADPETSWNFCKVYSKAVYKTSL